MPCVPFLCEGLESETQLNAEAYVNSSAQVICVLTGLFKARPHLQAVWGPGAAVCKPAAFMGLDPTHGPGPADPDTLRSSPVLLECGLEL